ncbi:MAG: hypothetical protein EA412_03355 [Chitinophagaceae bacterium]|nr:MAG: hypothetical protein EA412_03355 [Chitinophagaceae bacterium]
MILTEPKKVNTLTNAFEFRETRNYPILSLCDDINTYVVKHNRAQTPCDRLAIELIAHYFLKIWKINTPEIAIVDVDPQHVRHFNNTQIQEAFFRLPCIGSHFFKDAIEFNHFFGSIKSYEKSKFADVNDFLKLALFDIWMANEDRTANNPNFLIQPKHKKYHVMAIDHESCFNSGTFNQPLAPLTLEDSILYHKAIKHILSRKQTEKANLDILIQEMYLCIKRCVNHTDEILSYIPLEWDVSVDKIKQKLKNNLFTKDWLLICERTFKEHINTAFTS